MNKVQTDKTLPDYGHKLLFLNAPPRAGKDTAARFIKQAYGYNKVREYKMSQPIKDAFCGTFDIPIDRREYYLEARKDEPCIELGFPTTPRQWQINFYNDNATRYGEDFLGVIAMGRLVKVSSHFATVLSDSGRASECKPLVKTFRSRNCFMLHITRDGCTFENDSRELIDHAELGIRGATIHNCYDLELYRVQVLGAVEGFLGSLE